MGWFLFLFYFILFSYLHVYKEFIKIGRVHLPQVQYIPRHSSDDRSHVRPVPRPRPVRDLSPSDLWPLQITKAFFAALGEEKVQQQLLGVMFDLLADSREALVSSAISSVFKGVRGARSHAPMASVTFLYFQKCRHSKSVLIHADWQLTWSNPLIELINNNNNIFHWYTSCYCCTEGYWGNERKVYSEGNSSIFDFKRVFLSFGHHHGHNLPSHYSRFKIHFTMLTLLFCFFVRS